MPEVGILRSYYNLLHLFVNINKQFKLRPVRAPANGYGGKIRWLDGPLPVLPPPKAGVSGSRLWAPGRAQGMVQP